MKLANHMARRTLLTITVASLAAAALAGPAPELEERTFTFTYKAVVEELPAGAAAADVWLPYPQSDANQTIHSVTISAPGPVTVAREPRHGNEVLHYRAASPKGPIEIVMTVVATRRENAGHATELAPAEAAEYLKAEPLVPLDGPVGALAKETTAGLSTDAEKARAIYEKVTNLLKYDKSGTGWGRGDAIWACDAKRGNCTDFHALIIGMARSQGIPARFAMGVPLPEKRGEGEVPGYHCWAELYVKGRGWVPIDSSEAAKALAAGDVAKKDYFYGHHDENRLEFSRGRHLVLEPRQQGEPLNYFVYPYVEVDGKPWTAVKRTFAYADRAAPAAGKAAAGR